MNRFRTTHLIAALPVLLLGVAPAFAQDAPPPVPPISQAPTTQPVQPVERSAERAPATANAAASDVRQVLERVNESVDPLQAEMAASFRVFGETMQEAQWKLEEGNVREAIEDAVQAIDGVLASRDRVLVPMWEGQAYLMEQTADVRGRLTEALQADGIEPGESLDEASEQMLDRVASRIATETDDLRKRRLAAHYRAIRSLAQMRQMAARMSPDQQKLWVSVLTVLQEAQQTHLELMLGAETLFAQFEVSAEALHGYLTLIETMDSTELLLDRVRGVGEESDGLAAFSASLAGLQTNLEGFTQSVEGLISGNLAELEATVDEAQADTPSSTDSFDAELDARLRRLSADGDDAAPDPANAIEP